MKKVFINLCLLSSLMLNAQSYYLCNPGTNQPLQPNFSVNSYGFIEMGSMDFPTGSTQYSGSLSWDVYFSPGGELNIEFWLDGFIAEMEVSYWWYADNQYHSFKFYPEGCPSCFQTGAGDSTFITPGEDSYFTAFAQLPQPIAFDFEYFDINIQMGLLGLDEVDTTLSIINRDPQVSVPFFWVAPCHIQGSTVNHSNCWDVKGSDGADRSMLIYIPDGFGPATFSTCAPYTNYDTKVEVFNTTATSEIIYNDDYNCGLKAVTSPINLSEGLYYAVVDGYGGATGNFQLDVTSAAYKSARQNNMLGLSDEEYELYKQGLLHTADVELFPNPAHNYFSISLNENNNAEVLLYDASGRLIRSKTAKSLNFDVDCSDLNKGLYIVRIINGADVSNHTLVIE